MKMGVVAMERRRGQDIAERGATRSPYPSRPNALFSFAVSDDTFTVRTMTKDDLPSAAKLAGKLVRMHHDFDPQRFLHIANPEAGYARYFAGELESDAVVLLVAERTGDGAIVGNAYGRLEPRSYNELLDSCGKLHDVLVDESARGHGLGEQLVSEVVRRLTEKGAPRVLLLTAVQNEAAQRLFKKLGFRTTMLEMTREADPAV
jgi:ribosomal protein S18 acetylase RimI-like enzyme